jgi:hypothetical protein
MDSFSTPLAKCTPERLAGLLAMPWRECPRYLLLSPLRCTSIGEPMEDHVEPYLRAGESFGPPPPEPEGEV